LEEKHYTTRIHREPPLPAATARDVARANASPARPEPACHGETELATRLAAHRMPARHDYTTGEVATLIGICRETVRQMIIRWEPPEVPNRDPSGLFALRLGRKRRVPHRALVAWFERNSAYDRDMW